MIMSDIAGKPGLMLRVDVPRDIYHQGQHTLNYLATSLLIVGLLFGTLFLVLMERLVLSRLLHLGRQVAAVRAKEDPSSRVSDMGEDELGTLSRQINDMLTALERSQAEWRANDRQRQAAALLDSLPAYAYMKTTTGRYLAANSMFGRLVGVRPQEIVGRSDDDLFPSAVAQRYREHEMAVLGSGESQAWEEEITDGEPRIVASRVVPFRNDEGQIDGLIGIKFDISDRKATEAALSEEKERALITLGSIGDGVITTDISYT
jgi:PAS domain S-box-containing protein